MIHSTSIYGNAILSIAHLSYNWDIGCHGYQCDKNPYYTVQLANEWMPTEEAVLHTWTIVMSGIEGQTRQSLSDLKSPRRDVQVCLI